MHRVALVDYGSGNYASVRNAFRHLGVTVADVERPEQLEAESHIVLPGVGAFGNVMDKLSKSGFTEAIRREVLHREKFFLGICVGMQVLATTGMEFGSHPGLGIIPGKVTPIEPDDGKLSIPHMGWNQVSVQGDCALFTGMDLEPTFYFVHSFHFLPDNPEDRLGICDYGGPVTACVGRNRVFGVQFHPEKSQEAGLQLLRNFANIC